MTQTISLRAAAADTITRVALGESLSDLLPKIQEKIPPKNCPLLAELTYGTIRYYYRLNAWLNILMHKPLMKNEQLIHSLILLGLYQLFYTRIPPHAAIGETVQVTRHIGKAWARGLVNGILRNAQRQSEQLLEMAQYNHLTDNEICASAHPPWLLKMIKNSWPNDWQNIIRANNQKAPMILRVNQQKISRERYLKKLLDNCIKTHLSHTAPEGIRLEKPMQVNKLPYFSNGYVSIQDESAQLAAHFLPVKKGDYILDACCAPGGKTAHLLETYPEITIDALDINKNRLERVQETLDRIGHNARIIHGDANEPEQWWCNQHYDHILLDAPCSATGVIRRHPDIKLLRREQDISKMVNLQTQLLDKLWRLLKPNGYLLYATCSILPEENNEQIQIFIQKHSNVQLIPIKKSFGINTNHGFQLLPNIGDGFFYCLLKKLN